ncbi:hypothetical protein CPC16_010191 [Podila verticillata]|nr:hypothetical protein CPC16_010191 [Podila verticillata]
MSFDWPVLRPMRFLAKSRGNTHTTSASSYISSRGFTLQTATAGNRLPRSHYGPGTVFQGELNLHLLKAIPSPCQLRIVLTCHQTITPMAQDGPNASSVASSKPTTLFTVEHILVNNEALAAKRHFFHFSIKFPMCNYAPSYKDENGRSVVYSAKAFLTFETQPTNPASKAELSSPELELKYLPVVPASIPRNEVVENAQLVDPTTNQTCIRATVDSSQRGMSPGESMPLTFSFTNNSQSDLHTIHVALVRQASFATSSSPSSSTCHDAPPYSSPEYSLIHSTVIPISKPSNKNLSWSQPVQLILPPSLDLVPTTNVTITPLFRINYFLVVNIPVGQHHLGRIPFGARQLSLPIINDTIFSASSASSNGCVNIKGLTVLQFAPIPITMGTVPSRIPTSRLKWPLPSHAEVSATPVFVRDRFEEEMIKQLSSMESLMMEEDDEQDIAELVKAAEARRLSLSEMGHHHHSSGSSDEDDDANMHPISKSGRLHSTLPIRFRQGSVPPRHNLKGSQADIGMSPPPSPPSTSRTVLEDAMAFHALSQPQAQARSKDVPRPSQVPGSSSRLSTSPRSGLGKELLMGLHQSRAYHMRPEGLQDI